MPSPCRSRARASGTTTASRRSGHQRRIFATLPDDEHLRVFLPDEDIRAAVAEWSWCEEQLWGARLAAVRVVLADCDPAVVAELVEDAWRHNS